MTLGTCKCPDQMLLFEVIFAADFDLMNGCVSIFDIENSRMTKHDTQKREGLCDKQYKHYFCKCSLQIGMLVRRSRNFYL